MSENKKDLVLENGVKGDSTNKVDEVVVNQGAYVKAPKLTLEDLRKLYKFPVEISLIEREIKDSDKKIVYASFELTLAQGIKLTLSRDKFAEGDFYYFRNIILPKYFSKAIESGQLNTTSKTYILKFPVRFVTGKYKNKNNEEFDYYCCPSWVILELFTCCFLTQTDLCRQAHRISSEALIS